MKNTDINRMFIVILVYACVVFYFLYRYVKTRDFSGDSGDRDGRLWKRRFYVLAAAALVLRLFFAGAIEGFPSDISCFKAWSEAAANNFFALYDNRTEWFIDYPPGYMYILMLLGSIR